MELWIRSQDREKLVKVNYVYVVKNQINSFTIYGETIDSSPIIGRYATKERALEVLDEIHNAIITNTILELTINKIPVADLDSEKASKLFKDIVYEMPKE